MLTNANVDFVSLTWLPAITVATQQTLEIYKTQANKPDTYSTTGNNTATNCCGFGGLLVLILHLAERLTGENLDLAIFVKGDRLV